MNKIIIENSVIKEKKIDDNIRVSYYANEPFLSVNNLEIECLNDTILYIFYNNDIKVNVLINCVKNSNVKIFEKYIDGNLKVRNVYNIANNSTLDVQKFYDVCEIKQFDIINLNGDNASINYVLKTISYDNEKYNLLINHNALYTKSNVINNAVNVNDGKVSFDVTGMVPKGIVGCLLNQVNRIVTFNNNKCQINPNLLIDENDVIANHSAFIGKFNDDELFYLQSRGIKYDEAIKLLVGGFIFENLTVDDDEKKKIESIVKKYWG